MSMSKMVIKQSALLFVVTLGSVQAATLEFIQPIGNVLPNESIDVWVRLTADSGDLSFDLSDPDDDGTYGNLNSFGAIPTGGFNDTGEFLEFSSIDNVYPSLSFLCTGSFAGDDSSPCPPGANYEFNFNTSGSDSFLSLNDFMLPSGTSEDFLFGTFNPVAGGANPGSYDFFTASLVIGFEGIGIDTFGIEQDINARMTLAETCPGASCSFSRTVVPLPAAIWLFAPALAFLGFFRASGTIKTEPALF